MLELPPQIQKPLSQAVKKLIIDLSNNGQVTDHQRKVAENKIYDKFEKKYIVTQKLKKQLAEDYESSGSDEEMDGQYHGLSLYQLKSLTRKKLIQNKYKEQLLPEIQIPEMEQPTVEQNEGDSDSDICEYNEVDQKLKVINENNEIFEEHLKDEKNLYALKFLIDELENKID